MKNRENRDVLKRNINYFIEKLIDLEEQKHEIQRDIASTYCKANDEGYDKSYIKKIIKAKDKKRRKEETKLTKDNAFVQLLADIHFN